MNWYGKNTTEVSAHEIRDKYGGHRNGLGKGKPTKKTTVIIIFIMIIASAR